MGEGRKKIQPQRRKPANQLKSAMRCCNGAERGALYQALQKMLALMKSKSRGITNTSGSSGGKLLQAMEECVIRKVKMNEGRADALDQDYLDGLGIQA